MRTLVISIFLYLVMLPQVGAGELALAEQEYRQRADDVSVGATGASVPVGRIMLIRKGVQYGAIKFTNAWIGRFGWERATYESYYQGDGTGDFSKANVQVRNGRLSLSKEHWVGGGHHINFWRDVDIRCGPLKLLWTYRTNVCFFSDSQEQGDYGIELAPTKWTAISQVNVFDPRVKWYRYDEKRRAQFIPIDQLWEDEKKK